MASFTSTGPFAPADDGAFVYQSDGRATIRSSPILADDHDGLYEDNDDPFGIWLDYIVNNKFEREQHTYMMGVASPSGFQGGTAAFVRLTAPTLLWICDWTASRVNSPPDIPDPDNSDSSWVLLNDSYEPTNIVPGSDGFTPIYRISGTYVYGHRNPSDNVTDFIVFPRPPWMTDVGADRRTLNTRDLLQNVSNLDSGSS